MDKQLYIDIWGEIQKKNAREQAKMGLSGIAEFQLDETQIHKTAYHLSNKLQIGCGSTGSWYTLFIPISNDNEVVKLRISDHLSTEDEWRQHEITGLPNRRYSIVIYNRHSTYIQHKNKENFIDWETYEVDGIEVYELCIHCNYVSMYWQYLYYVIKSIYLGGRPEDEDIPNITH